MDANLIVTIGLGVGTILASGLTSSVVTYRLNRNKDQFDFMRTKAEALYLAAEEYGRTLGSYAISHYPVAKGEIDWNEMLDRQIEMGSGKKEHGGAQIVIMLISIYFPSVRPALASVFDARDKINKFASEMKRAYIEDGGRLNANEWVPRLNKVAADIDAAVKGLEEAIVAAARTYAGVRQQ